MRKFCYYTASPQSQVATTGRNHSLDIEIDYSATAVRKSETNLHETTKGSRETLTHPKRSQNVAPIGGLKEATFLLYGLPKRSAHVVGRKGSLAQPHPPRTGPQ